MKSKYSYRVSSSKAGSHITPMTFTHTLGGAIEAAQGHNRELPGCETVIEKNDGNDWKLWAAGNWSDLAGGVLEARVSEYGVADGLQKTGTIAFGKRWAENGQPFTLP